VPLNQRSPGVPETVAPNAVKLAEPRVAVLAGKLRILPVPTVMPPLAVIKPLKVAVVAPVIAPAVVEKVPSDNVPPVIVAEALIEVAPVIAPPAAKPPEEVKLPPLILPTAEIEPPEVTALLAAIVPELMESPAPSLMEDPTAEAEIFPVVAVILPVVAVTEVNVPAAAVPVPIAAGDAKVLPFNAVALIVPPPVTSSEPPVPIKSALPLVAAVTLAKLMELAVMV